MDITTQYLGLTLKNPLVLGASPLTDKIETARQVEDAGAGAIVLRSLFVEQIEGNQDGYASWFQSYEESFAEALSYFPEMEDWALGPDQYLSHIQKLKSALSIPVIASINGTGEGDWFQYAHMMEEAGADALELNLYFLAVDPSVSGRDLEDRLIRIVQNIRNRIGIPLVVKLSPFYSSLSHFAQQLDRAGADALLLFNRFYQPDIDIENLEVMPSLQLSNSSELLLRLRWVAILYGRIDCDLAISGGVHTAEDVVKSLMSGANAVQIVSGALKKGPPFFQTLQEDLKHLLERLEYSGLEELRGSMSHLKSGNSEAIERTNYMKTLHSWKPEP